ncbi:MAG: hypothetical protein ACOYWZ_15965 [Bacillota bacterium]
MRRLFLVISYRKLCRFIILFTLAIFLIFVIANRINSFNSVKVISSLAEDEITELLNENSRLKNIFENILPKENKLLYEDKYRNLFKNIKNYTPPYVEEQPIMEVLEKGRKVSFKVLSNSQGYLRPIYSPDWKAASYRGWLYLPGKNIDARHRLFIFPFGGSSIYDFTGSHAFDVSTPIDYHMNINFLIYDYKVNSVIKHKHQVLLVGEPAMKGAQVISVVQDDLLAKEENRADFLFHLSTPKGYEIDYIYDNVIRYEYLMKKIKEHTVKSANANIDTLEKLLDENLTLKKELSYFIPTQDKLITKEKCKPIAPTFPYEAPDIKTIRERGMEVPFNINFNNDQYKRPVYDPLWLQNYKRRWCYIPRQVCYNLQRLFVIPKDPKEHYDFLGMLSFHESYKPLREDEVGFLIYNFDVKTTVVYKRQILLIGEPKRTGAQIITFDRKSIQSLDYIVHLVTPDDQEVDYTYLINSTDVLTYYIPEGAG